MVSIPYSFREVIFSKDSTIEFFMAPLPPPSSPHLKATVLEEMPPFPHRESSLLSKLYQTAPWTAKLHTSTGGEGGEGGAAAGLTLPTVSNGPVVAMTTSPPETTLITTAPVTGKTFKEILRTGKIL